MRTINNQTGFTIFEALIYIALFTIVVGGSILTAYQLFQGSAQVERMSEQAVELNFIQRKFDWAMRNATVYSPTESDNDPLETLILNKKNDDGTIDQYKIKRDTTTDDITVQKNSDEALPLTSWRTKVTDLSFTRNNSVDPNILTITMSVNDEALPPIIYYLR